MGSYIIEACFVFVCVCFGGLFLFGWVFLMTPQHYYTNHTKKPGTALLYQMAAVVFFEVVSVKVQNQFSDGFLAGSY